MDNLPARVASRWLQGRSPYQRGDIVLYKGRKYRLLWSGRTRFGEKAKLEFLNGRKEFWVDIHKIESTGTRSPYRRRSRKVQFHYWNGRTEWMTPEEAEIAEDMGQGTT